MTATAHADDHHGAPGRITLRRYLLYAVLAENPGPRDIWLAYEAVHSTALEHPEWDLDEQRTWLEWVAWDGGRWSWAEA